MTNKDMFKDTTYQSLHRQVDGNHYKKFKIEPAHFISENHLEWAEGEAIKYICRHAHKGEAQDLEKAKHYIDMIIERDYGDETQKSQVFKSRTGSNENS